MYRFHKFIIVLGYTIWLTTISSNSKIRLQNVFWISNFANESLFLVGIWLGTWADIVSTQQKFAREMKKWDHDRSNLSVFLVEENIKSTNPEKKFWREIFLIEHGDDCVA